MKKKWQVKYATVIGIFDTHLLLSMNDKEIICPIKEISDYNVNLTKMFAVGRTYKFSLVYDEENEKEPYISYKIGRPKLLKKRTIPTATLSGFKNVNTKMHKCLKEYKLD